MTEEDQAPRYTPVSDLEYHWLTTETGWGKDATPELKTKLTKILKEKNIYDPYGEKVEDTEQLWGLLSYYTRDIRLGNLSRMNGEVKYVIHWLNLAGDSLRAGLPKSFLSAITRAISVIEVSQSVNGFLRRRPQTYTHESVSQQLEPKKRGVFGNNKRSMESDYK